MTIVFTIAEEPLRDASVVAPFRTTAPTGGTISLAANVGGFIGSVPTIVV